jgi:23S rRNA (guanosine2251-2'-O)-methyltransferase
MPKLKLGPAKNAFGTIGRMAHENPVPYRVTRGGAAYDGLERLPVSVLLANVRSAYNVGAFFRTAEAVRCEHLYLSGISPPPTHRGVVKTALGAEERVAWSAVADPIALVDQLVEASVRIAAIETSLNAEDLFDWSPSFPVCIAFGNEVDGLPAALLERATDRVRIPMLGFKQSLNVATAGGVVLYELLRKFRTSLTSRA